MNAAKLTTIAQADVAPDHIMQVGMGFWASKVAAERRRAWACSRTSAMARRPGRETGARRWRCIRAERSDLLDAPLVALGLLALRRRRRSRGSYRNTAETASVSRSQELRDTSAASSKWRTRRLYRFWADLHAGSARRASRRTRSSTPARPMFDELYADPARLEQFIGAMTGVSRPTSQPSPKSSTSQPYKTLLRTLAARPDSCSCIVASRHAHLSCRSCDLPVVKPIAERHIRERAAGRSRAGARRRLLARRTPKADLITMGMILHDWNLDSKKMLIAKAYRAAAQGRSADRDRDMSIDDGRRQNAFGLLMSLNMLIEFGDAFDFTGADFAGWCREAGFSRCEVLPLAGPASAAIGLTSNTRARLLFDREVPLRGLECVRDRRANHARRKPLRKAKRPRLRGKERATSCFIRRRTAMTNLAG